MCVFAPHVSPRWLNSVCAESYPTITLPFKFGTLNVVDPFHNPYGQNTRVWTPDCVPDVFITAPHLVAENWKLLAVNPAAAT